MSGSPNLSAMPLMFHVSTLTFVADGIHILFALFILSLITRFWVSAVSYLVIALITCCVALANLTFPAAEKCKLLRPKSHISELFERYKATISYYISYQFQTPSQNGYQEYIWFKNPSWIAFIIKNLPSMGCWWSYQSYIYALSSLCPDIVTVESHND